MADVAGGALTSVSERLGWATIYWDVKSDRSAPGVPGLKIDTSKGHRKNHRLAARRLSGGGVDTGQPRRGERDDQLDERRDAAPARRVVGQVSANQPIPWPDVRLGTRIERRDRYTDRDGRLTLLDQQKHKQTIAGVKDALLPA